MQVHELKQRLEAQMECVELQTIRLLEAIGALEQIDEMLATHPKDQYLPEVCLQESEFEGSSAADPEGAVKQTQSEPPTEPKPDRYTQTEKDVPTTMELLRSRLADKYSAPQSRFPLSLAG